MITASRTRLLAPLLALCLATALAACGSDSSGSTDAGDGDDSTTEAGETTTTDAMTETSAETDGDEAADADAETGTITIVDSQDRSVEVPMNPETIVVMDWSAIRTLTDLGVEIDGVPAAVGTLPADLATIAESAASTGTLFEPDYEAISALQPDLIIVGSRSGTPEVVAEMEKISPAVIDMSVRYDEAQDQMPQFRLRVEQMASIFGLDAEAAERLDAIDAAVAEAAAAAEASGTTAMFVQVSGGTVGAYGPGSRFGILFDELGFSPTDAPLDEEGSHGQEISQEFFVQYNPGVIFVLDRSKTIGEEADPALDVLSNGLVDTTDAATNDRIIEVDGFSWYIATYAPSSFERIIADAASGR